MSHYETILGCRRMPCGAELDLGDFACSCARVDHRDIFEREKVLYRGQSCLAVLGTCLMFVCSCAPGLIDRERVAELCGLERGRSGGRRCRTCWAGHTRGERGRRLGVCS